MWDVVKAFRSDRTDQAFAVSMLPRRAQSRRLVANAHDAKTLFEDVAIGAVMVADEIFRRLFPAAASVSWRAMHSAVGCAVTPHYNILRRSFRMIIKP